MRAKNIQASRWRSFSEPRNAIPTQSVANAASSFSSHPCSVQAFDGSLAKASNEVLSAQMAIRALNNVESLALDRSVRV